MMGTALVVFREALEAAIIVSIVMAATRGVAGRGRYVLLGIGAGIAGAALVAAFSGAIADLAQGIGQELLNASILFAAVFLLGWHNVWMQRHGRELAQKMTAVGRAVAEGSTSLHVLSVVVGLAVLREGAEVVLFLYGIAAGGMGSNSMMFLGGIVGLAAGAGLGALIYGGLVQVSQRRLFAVTGWMLLLLAAGLSAQGAGYLAQADVLPELVRQVWDTSSVISQHSLLGQFLHAFLGYQDRPSGIEVLFYAVTLAVIGVSMRLAAPRRLAGAVGCAVLAIVAFQPAAARASTLKVYEPYVEQGAWELEYKGWQEDDIEGGDENRQVHQVSVGYGVTSYWFTEGVMEFEREGSESLRLESFEWENVFQLTPQGKYWADLGFLTELEIPRDGDKPDELIFGPLIQKQTGPIVNTANILFETQFGRYSADGVALLYAWQSRWRLNQYFEPGFEAYGELGEIGHFNPGREQEHRIGPMFQGKVKVGHRGGYIKYVLGVLVGLTHEAPDLSLNWRIEYETRF